MDGRKNGTETDIDCGGAAAPACATGKACGTAGDCASAVCTLGVCQAPTSTDGVKNGAETDIDCGGAGNPKCVDTKACTGRDDCVSDVCTGNVCVAPTDADGVKNGTETDVDCGGPTAKRCDAGLACNGADDCASKHCDTGGTGKCLAPTFSDGIQNGTETDIDCGGTAGHECPTGQSCLAGTDCSSGGCNDKKLCAAGKSCTNPGGAGAYTCGTGGAGGSGAEAWEDCCATIPVTTGAGTVKLDKYQTTSGRMRVFLESVGYDVRGFVKQARADGKIPTAPGTPTKSVLEPAWDAYLPTSFDGNANADELVDCDQGGYDTTYGQCCAFYAPTNGTCPQGGSLANGVCHYWNGSCPAGRDTRRPGVYTSVQNQLGGTIFRGNSQTQTGCFVGAPGTHTFRFPDGKQDGEAPEQPQSVYDTKSMTCANYLMAQAFCVWDGGRLETTAEWLTAYGAGTYPWSPGDVHGPQGIGTNSFNGCRFPTATNASHPDCSLYWNTAATSIDLTNYAYSYEYPALADTANDFVVFIAAPGRTLGRGPLGHADVIGNVFELTSTIDFPATPTPFNTVVHWSGNGSWEGHGWTMSPDTTYKYAIIRKYGKTGFRCAKL